MNLKLKTRKQIIEENNAQNMKQVKEIRSKTANEN